MDQFLKRKNSHKYGIATKFWPKSWHGFWFCKDPVKMFLRFYKLLATMDVQDWFGSISKKTHTGIRRVH